VEILYGIGEREKGKEKNRTLVISQNLRSVKVEDIRMCIEIVENGGGVGGKGVRESNERG
jgi:hypothetical protein